MEGEAMSLKPIRRLVIGDDGAGHGKVLFDGTAPNAHPSSMSAARGHTDLWVWDDTPMALSPTSDDGRRSYVFPGSVRGGHLRVVQSVARPAHYDRATDPENVPEHPPKVRPGCTGVWDRGGNGLYSSSMHKTQTVDFGLMVEGSRELVLDEGSTLLETGDVVIQVGAWHQWGYPTDARMAFAMIGADFPGGNGNAVGNDVPRAPAAAPAGIALTRRVVTIDRPDGRSAIVSDTPCPDVLLDPARPGLASQRMWVVERCPAPIVYETLHLPRTLEPHNGGSLLMVDILPPDQPWIGQVGRDQVQHWFERCGSPTACAWHADAPHPYMKHTRTFDYCVVMEGEATLFLDGEALSVRAGEVVLLKGVRHAWGNRSGSRAVVATTIIEGV
jgi:quercetin dioxygenase-like cupin family protein